MNDFRTQIKPNLRIPGIEEIRNRITGGERFGDVMSRLSSLEIPEIKALRDAARKFVLADPTNLGDRQIWVFYEALYRDLKYGQRERSWLRQQGWDGLMEQCYSGARSATNAGIG